ncbi:hypothetical protein GCM10025867_30000 [Frondihabitans sucicola]|uniref:DUF997 family protein n=1 Tax=Frondihabitans sucicola TaxID=1268041 RepID=A0ABN6Y089_9MICO|nr:hypothetical protein [Frondihabitans sucicola]BDZ50759.1 hypothetical protein GCM10025867_30000 [Frondihabitans sucicola]
MSSLGSEKKGLGLDVTGPDEPSYLPGPVVARPRHWWLTGRSLASSILFCALWTGYAVLRFVEIMSKSHVSGTDWLLFALPTFLALGAVPSVVFFARSAHRRPTPAPGEPRSMSDKN